MRFLGLSGCSAPVRKIGNDDRNRAGMAVVPGCLKVSGPIADACAFVVGHKTDRNRNYE
jgi:hypothetical protein